VAMTQETVILQHLMQHGSITSFEAIQLYGVTRLSAIIYTLRHKRGFNIATDFVNSPDTPYLHIRKIPKKKYTIDELIKIIMMTEEMADYLVNKAVLSSLTPIASAMVAASLPKLKAAIFSTVAELTKAPST